MSGLEELHIDFETRSEVELKDYGLDNYCAGKHTSAWCMAYAFGDGPVELWHPALLFPDCVADHVAKGGVVVAHNAPFEHAIWNRILTRTYALPALRIEQLRCTMAMAYAMGLPGSLDGAAAAAGLSVSKDMAGNRLMKQMARPRGFDEFGEPQWWDDDERKRRLFDYCVQDVIVERELQKRLVPLSSIEQKTWELDFRINLRGITVDPPLLKNCSEMVDRAKLRLNDKMNEVTDGWVSACTNVNQLTDFLRLRGVETKGVAKTDIEALMLQDDLPEDCRTALGYRQLASKSSTSKIPAMIRRAYSDNKLRYLFQYHAASTGRWGGRDVQPHNFPRPKLEQADIEIALTLVKNREYDFAELCYGEPMIFLSSCLRGLLMAAPGTQLVAADFSAIEARVLAWLAGEEKVLVVFRTHGKIYEAAAADIYSVLLDEVSKDQRQIGKVAVLALGYQGGVGAFQSMAKVYGVKVDDDRADQIKVAWRIKHPNIVKYWYALEEAAVAAVRSPGTTTKVGKGHRAVYFKKVGSFLFCRLPSGRKLCYPYPRMELATMPWGDKKEVIVYKSVDSQTKKWVDTKTYGGMLAENITQAVSRDLLRDAMFRVEDAGYEVVLHVHDEIVAQADPEKINLHEFEQLCAITPDWAEGLPISAEGWTGTLYRK